jgi:hypothetical protein
MVQRFRVNVGRRVVLLPNGLTTGGHKSKEHAAGLAADVGFYEADGPVDIRSCFAAALDAGARGIGIYWNGAAYSMHMDLRKPYSFWCGTKRHRESEWRYLPLIINPAEVV